MRALRAVGAWVGSGSEARFFALAALGYLVALAAYLFDDPTRIARDYLGDPTYGAYQGTLWWYAYFGEHVVDFGAWLHSDLQKVPFGTRPYVMYANDFLVGLLFQPFRLLPTLAAATNVFVAVMLAASALATCALARGLGAGRAFAFAAGLAVPLNHFVAGEIMFGRLSLLVLWSAPLFLLAWHRAFGPEHPRRWLAAAVAMLAITWQIYPYYAIFFGISALFLPLVLRPPIRRYLAWVALLVAGSALLAAPTAVLLLMDYGDFSTFRSDCQVYAPCAFDLPNNFRPVFEHSLSVDQLRRSLLDPGVLGCLLGLLGTRRPRVFALVGLSFAVFALGPYAVGTLGGEGLRCLWGVPLPYWLFYGLVPGARTFSHPVRFLAVTHVCGAVSFALLLADLAAHEAVRRWGWVLTLAAFLPAATWVGLNRTVGLHPAPPTLEVLATVGDGESPLILLPLGSSDFYHFAQIFHRRPTLNGSGLELQQKNLPDAEEFLAENSVLSFFEGLYGVSPPPAFTADHLMELQVYGFRQVVLLRYVRKDPWIQRYFFQARGVTDYGVAMLRAERRLADRFGAPVYLDDLVAVYDLR